MSDQEAKGMEKTVSSASLSGLDDAVRTPF
jgi:hypothetical protein